MQLAFYVLFVLLFKYHHLVVDVKMPLITYFIWFQCLLHSIVWFGTIIAFLVIEPDASCVVCKQPLLGLLFLLDFEIFKLLLLYANDLV